MLKYLLCLLLTCSVVADTQWAYVTEDRKQYAHSVFIILDGDNSRLQLVEQIDDKWIFILFKCKVVEREGKKYLRLESRSYKMPPGYKINEQPFAPREYQITNKHRFILTLHLGKATLDFIETTEGRVKE